MASELTLETVLKLLPEQEELNELRTAIIRAGVPDPAMRWSRSGAFATIDKRIVDERHLQSAIDDAERSYQAHGSHLFATYRSLMAAYAANDHAAVIDCLLNLAEKKELAGLFASARRFLEAALHVAEPLAQKRPHTLVMHRMGRVCRAAGDLREALRHYERAAVMARDAGDAAALVNSLVGGGSVLALQSRWAEAEAHHLEALELCGDGGEEPGIRQAGQIFNNLGYFAARQQRLDEAESLLARAMEIWKRVTAPTDLGVCHHCLAYVAKAREDWKAARRHYDHALELILPATVRAGISIDMADLYVQMGDIEGAQRWGRTAEDEAISSNSPYLLGRVYQVRGNVARAAGIDDGFTFYEKALEIAREREIKLLEGETLLDYSRLRMSMGEMDEAISYLERAREIFAAAGALAELRLTEAMLGGSESPPLTIEPPLRG